MDLGSVLALIFGFLLYVGPVGALALYLWFMATKKGWAWPIIIVATIFGLLLGATVPGLSNSMNDGLQNIFTSISKST